MDTGDGDAPTMSIGKMCEELRSGNHLYMFERNEIASKLERLVAENTALHARVKTLTRYLGWPSPSGLREDVSELMKYAGKAADRVAEWSPEKREYANRIINSKRRTDEVNRINSKRNTNHE